MNASDYLRKQGWRGTGFSLDKSDRGLAKPLLVSHKSDQSGLGTKKNDFGNQWWNTAFEKSLKNIGSEEAAATALPHHLQVKQAALYSRFLKAETLVSDFKPQIQGSDLGMGKSKKHTGSSSAAEVDTMPGSGVRLTTGPILGVPANDTKGPVVGEEQEKKAKKEKKRKRDDGLASDVQEGPWREKRSKRPKNTKTQPLPSAKEAVPSPADVPTPSVGEPLHLPHRFPVDQPAATDKDGDTSGQQRTSKPKAEKEIHRGVRARRPMQRAEKSRENAQRNKERDEAETAQAVADGIYIAPEHSTADLRNVLDGPPHEESIMAIRQTGLDIDLPGDENDADWLRQQLIQSYEKDDLPRVKRLINQAYPAVDPQAPVSGVVPTKKASYKAAKYERESAKRIAKRDARHWVEVRANLHLYRPDGKHVSGKAGEELGEEVEEEVEAKRKAEKDAKRKAEKDAKRQSREEKQAKRQTKEQKKLERRTAKRLKRAEKKRENHMAMQAHISAKIAQQKKEQDEAAATDAGMIYDVYIAHRAAAAESKRVERSKAKAAELGLSYAPFTKNQEGNHSGMPILGIEERLQGDTKVPTDSDEEWTSEDSSDESESASDDDVLEIAAKTSTSASNTAKSADMGADFIPLGDDPASDGAGFMIDTVGDATQTIDPDAPKKVKDMTKAERKARLEQMRERRAARKAAAGETTMSKKERRKRRASRKEEMINKMTNDLLEKARNEAKGRGDAPAITEGQSNPERKKMRREARRIMRGMKKGKIPQEELMEGWYRPGSRRDKPRLRGNGGREPKTRADLFR